MVEKTRSIVLYSLPYKDNLSIVYLLTEKRGKLSCFLPVSRSKKTVVKSNMFQPLSILNLEIDFHTKKDIHRIKEAQIDTPLNQIPFHPIKLSLAQFIAEFIYKAVHEHEQSLNLFHFVEHAIQILDLSEKSVANFHLVFLFKLTAYLGFYPNIDHYADNTYFDLINGVYADKIPYHNHYLKANESKVLHDILQLTFDNLHEYPLLREERQQFISILSEFYRLHLTGFPEIKSFEVLKMLF
jgi:DNA repair protein RecO